MSCPDTNFIFGAQVFARQASPHILKAVAMRNPSWAPQTVREELQAQEEWIVRHLLATTYCLGLDHYDPGNWLGSSVYKDVQQVMGKCEMQKLLFKDLPANFGSLVSLRSSIRYHQQTVYVVGYSTPLGKRQSKGFGKK